MNVRQKLYFLSKLDREGKANDDNFNAILLYSKLAFSKDKFCSQFTWNKFVFVTIFILICQHIRRDSNSDRNKYNLITPVITTTCSFLQGLSRMKNAFGLFFVYFRSSLINFYSALIWKCPSSIQHRDLNSQSLCNESSPLTTWPGFQPKNWQVKLRTNWH